MELYIHIPFCRKKCNYCDFASFAGQENRMEAYIETILKETEQQGERISSSIESIYIGGGTPSLLPSPLLFRLVQGIHQFFKVQKNAEFTIEANPGTITTDWLETAIDAGINRLSLGMQAYQNSLLNVLGRIHTFQDVKESVQVARNAGFQNISVDLIFGIPGQSENDWSETLSHVMDLSVDHISAYGLIPEEGTPIMKELQEKRLTLPSPEKERKMYEILKKTMTENGYEQYEISNFARQGAACRHNIGYWTQVPYLGIGLSAASMLHLKKEKNGISYTRIKNPSSFIDYERMVLEGDSTLQEKEVIFPQEARFETMMLGLRMNRGISVSDFFEMHGVSLDKCYGEKLRSFEKMGLIKNEKDRWFLTSRGMDIQNAILVELMED